MTFVHRVARGRYSFFLSVNGSRSSVATVPGAELVKNGRSGRYAISQTKRGLFFEFHM